MSKICLKDMALTCIKELEFLYKTKYDPEIELILDQLYDVYYELTGIRRKR